MANKIRVAVSPLTNTIFAGRVRKEGVWGPYKDDVTVDCLVAVAEHIEEFGEPVEVRDGQGHLKYRLTVECFKEEHDA